MDAMMLETLACLAGGFSGGCLALAGVRARDAARRARELRLKAGAVGADAVRPLAKGLSAWVLLQVGRQGQRALPPRARLLLARAPLGVGLGDTRPMLARAGMPEAGDELCLRAVRARLALQGLAAGLLAGAVFSAELACVLALAGAAAGYVSVVWALKREARARNADMERHLSEMLEVVILGLRSGLSFERSFALYPRYFRTELAQAMRRASGQWEMGLMPREEALRRFEAEYDSALLSRVVGSMVRSLRFGTSIAEALEVAAVEAREVHRARMEERVAKVAVKMMLPVGTLILPAMLLLVLGPVLLELIEGF